jgi:iron-sulfur cluster assembly accessory protein
MRDGTFTLYDETKPKPAPAEGVIITPAAQAKVREILDAEGKTGYGLRLAVQAGGCSGHSYGLYFDESPGADDIVYSSEGFDVFVDPPSHRILSGTVVDYVDSLQGSGFKIENPNASNACGCGKSFTV